MERRTALLLIAIAVAGWDVYHALYAVAMLGAPGLADSDLHDQAPPHPSSCRDDERLSEHHLYAVLRTIVGQGQERSS